MAARWRLAAAHYLKVDGNFWEYTEVDRTTGRPKRTQFPVPQMLNPEDPNDWNYVYSKDGFGKPDSGEIIVANARSDEGPRDIIFLSDPTPDMVPLNDEAKAISADFAKKRQWQHPIDSLPGTYADEMIKDMSKELDALRSQVAPPSEGITELLTAMTAMMKQNQELIAAVVGKSVPAASAPVRRT